MRNVNHTIDESFTASKNLKQQLKTTYGKVNTDPFEGNVYDKITDLSPIVESMRETYRNRKMCTKEIADKTKNIKFLLKKNEKNREIIDPIG